MNQVLTLTEKKRNAIISAAKSLFLSQGLRATSMDQIAQAAKVSKKTVYNHFPDKDTLFQFVITAHWNDVVAEPEQLFANVKSIKSALKHFATVFIDFVYHEQTVALFRILISESTHYPDLTQALLNNGKPPLTQQLITFFQQQAESHQLKIEDPALAASQFIGMLKEYHYWPMMLGFVNYDDKQEIDKAVDSAVDMIIHYYGFNSSS